MQGKKQQTVIPAIAYLLLYFGIGFLFFFIPFINGLIFSLPASDFFNYPYYIKQTLVILIAAFIFKKLIRNIDYASVVKLSTILFLLVKLYFIISFYFLGALERFEDLIGDLLISQGLQLLEVLLFYIVSSITLQNLKLVAKKS